ncbi:hypothetical protein STAQ_29380 [Allostella sp. ATCC 35155]|nr:hypothetical protein STAQ_29380 [Stella sp. ATCC 35155]
MTIRSAAMMAGTLMLALTACVTTDDAAPSLAGSSWQATRLGDGTAVRDPARLALAFATDGTVAVRADCNRGSGT